MADLGAFHAGQVLNGCRELQQHAPAQLCRDAVAASAPSPVHTRPALVLRAVKVRGDRRRRPCPVDLAISTALCERLAWGAGATQRAAAPGRMALYAGQTRQSHGPQRSICAGAGPNPDGHGHGHGHVRATRRRTLALAVALNAECTPAFDSWAATSYSSKSRWICMMAAGTYPQQHDKVIARMGFVFARAGAPEPNGRCRIQAQIKPKLSDEMAPCCCAPIGPLESICWVSVTRRIQACTKRHIPAQCRSKSTDSP